MHMRRLSPSQQGKATYDHGKIILQKPIGFPGEGSVVDRLGPLFYWSWGRTEQPSLIAAHPHQGFEIVSYIVEGQGFHRDSLGSEITLHKGDAQVMQCGSGLTHEEGSKGTLEMFQIWLEPSLRQALQRPPTYATYSHKDFPMETYEGTTVKTLIGEHSPMHLVTDAKMIDVHCTVNHAFTYTLAPHRTCAVLVYRGEGIVRGTLEPLPFVYKDFLIIDTPHATTMAFETCSAEMRLFCIDVPTAVDYPLHPKTR